MQLDTYIKDLLYRYECVIVPGFGAFLTHHQPARIEADCFYPPSKRISFNRQLQTNDGLLSDYIAKAESISYESALQKVRDKALFLKQEIAQGKKIVFTHIGSLEMNKQGNLIFEPDIVVNYLTASFGLSSYTSPEVVREIQKAEKPPVVLIPEKRTLSPMLRYAAVGLIAIGLAGFSGMYFYSDGVKQHNLTEKQKADILLENKIQHATFVVSNPLPELNISIKKEAGKYHIVAGAFRMEENALTKIEELKAKGFSARSIGANKYGLHQVVYGSYTGKDEAVRQMQHLKKTENADAWLLVQEL